MSALITQLNTHAENYEKINLFPNDHHSTGFFGGKLRKRMNFSKLYAIIPILIYQKLFIVKFKRVQKRYYVNRSVCVCVCVCEHARAHNFFILVSSNYIFVIFFYL